MKPTKQFILFIIASLVFIQAIAQQNSYLYIQGDKEKPFYVKVDGVMSNRYGKNYCLFSQLKSGTSKVEILFEQNTLPPQEYSILIPSNNYRAFLLVKKDGNYTLYDIFQQFYLKPGEEDHYFAGQTIEQTPIVFDEKKPEKETQKQVTENEIDPKKEDPKFINNVVINEADDNTNGNNGVATQKQEKKEEPKQNTGTVANVAKPQAASKEVKLESNATPIYNSNCPTAMRDKDFDEMLKVAKASGKGDKLVKYLLDKIPNNCYTTNQVYQLADLLDEEAIIYLYLKRVYPQVSDQQNFHLLESYLFESEEWIKAFRLIH